MRLFLLFLLLTSLATAKDHPTLFKTSWDNAFKKAQAEKKLVLLDLEAVWCHWCHVMDRTTYADPEVIKLLQENVVTVKVDQDARPDLSNRYAQYGWPATIVFDAEGRELAHLSGYQSPAELSSTVERLLKNPEPLKVDIPAAAGPGKLSPELYKRLQARHLDLYDQERGGWGRIHKFVNPAVVEYCLALSLKGDEQQRRMAIQTLDQNLKLVDPVWGGVYQYSDSGRWDSPHYEKIMSTQAGNLRIYSLAYAQFRNPAYLRAADQIATYLCQFLRGPNGAFYASQDADAVQGVKAHDYFEKDDQARRAAGIPRIDKNRYARENGEAIEALALFSAISGKKTFLEAAVQAATWSDRHRRLESGGYRHGNDSSILFLGDTLAMGRAHLMLYRVSGDPTWLAKATEASDFIEKTFSKADSHGYYTSTAKKVRDRNEQIALARFSNLLHHYTGRPDQRQTAEQALAYFAIPGVTDLFNPGGILLAEMELRSDPAHLTVVGSGELSALRTAAAAGPTSYLRLDTWRPGTPLPANTLVEYPVLSRPAVFYCSDGKCSAPVFEPEGLDSLWRF